jgi:hypothetical protein
MINVSLEIAEVEAILKHLAQAAYADVAGLIAKIHGQAIPQVQAIQAANPPIESVVSTQQTEPIVAEQNVA